MNSLDSKKIALVYDKVNTWGGAERVLLALHDVFPDAPLFTSVYDQNQISWAKIFPKVIPSFLQHFPFAKQHIQWFLPLMPLAFESLNFSNYDIVLSVTSGEAKSIITNTKTLHLCYCLTPPRYLWNDAGYNSYHHFGILNGLVHTFKSPLLHYLRITDYLSAQRPDCIATISNTAQKRIETYYRRQSQIIYPPVETGFFTPSNNWQLPKNNYFLIVSRLVPYKRIDIAIEACKQLNLPLKIAGIGPELEKLKQLNKPNENDSMLEILGSVTNEQLRELYQNCIALIMPQNEDFGIVALEAQACGKPVIAYGQGGALDTVIPHKTGIFFKQQTVDSLVQTLQQFNPQQYHSTTCREHAHQFSLDKFKSQMKQWVLSEWTKFKNSTT